METEVQVRDALARIAEHREVIDQAKGMVMLAAGCDADDAFGMLRRCSRNGNIKLHDAARQLIDAAGSQLGNSDDVIGFLEDLQHAS